MSAERTYHEPVLLAEVLRFLGDAKLVFDGTLGGGGHTAALLERGAHVVAVDRDPDAVAEATNRLQRFVSAGTLRVSASPFADYAESTTEQFDGALLDLGVSSHQIDEAARGFTFREGAPLDMRMDADRETAAEWLNSVDEHTLAGVFADYGDEPKAKRLARTIVHRRETHAFETSDDLVNAIRSALGARSGPPDFARLFQAVRIAVNDELDQLERALPALRDRLAPEGVFLVIAYHSGEDRLVKRAFQDWSRACRCPPKQPICTCGGVPLGTTLTKHPIEANEDEVSRNPRARSAKLRAWRKAPVDGADASAGKRRPGGR